MDEGGRTLGEPDHSDKRKHLRHPLDSDLTGRMISAASGSTIPCIAVDVSTSGLKIVLTLDLAPGTELRLKMGGKEIELIVMWCSKEPTRKGYFACGLATKSPVDDLEKVLLQRA